MSEVRSLRTRFVGDSFGRILCASFVSELVLCLSFVYRVNFLPEF